jgi:plasmid stabilization system protein ParE
MRELRFHPSAPIEARYFYRYYADISEALAEDFWRELLDAIEYAREFPERHHYDSIGVNLRRSNLERFPIHFLFKTSKDLIRVTVVRHNKQKPKFGLGRS